jgi:ABC-type lipoprotein release transport system permease subunit
MLEAGWIGIFGGIMGVILSLGLSFLLNKFNVSIGGSIIWTPDGQKTLPSSYIPYWLTFAAMVFSFIASLAAGLLPSRRAMKLSVMMALRQD